MTGSEFPACLASAVGILLACIALAARAVWQRRRRPVLRYPVGQDATHPRPDVAPRPVPPLDPPENPMRDTFVVARPARLWWDTT